MISRRRFNIAASAMVLSGCCARQYAKLPPDPSIQPTASGPDAALPWLGLEESDAMGSADVFAGVDAHTHFFNASDVPVKGFLGQNVAHSQPPVLRELLKLLARVADALAELAPTAEQELASHIDFDALLVQQANTSDLSEARKAWRSRVAREDLAAAERVSEVLKDSRFLRRYGELQADAVKSGATISSAGTKRERLREISPGQVLETVSRVRRAAPEAAATLEDAARSEARIADGVLGFLFYMLSLRACNVDAHRLAYGETRASWMTHHALAALVDFDYWLDCPPTSSHEAQIALHAYLKSASGGYITPLVAYNPWTDIALDGEGLRRVQRAMASGAFAGVKIYPPMGFFPGRNAGVPLESRKRRPKPEDLDRVLDAFFGYCEDEGVLVMAHAGYSSGRDDAHDCLSHPDAWKVRLEKNERLRINFGHFGGEAGTDWTMRFVDLMRSYPKHELYADIGYWDKLTCPSGVNTECSKLRGRLAGALRADIGGGQTGAERIMYGTDWHMISRIQNWPEYLPRIAIWLEGTVGREAARKVMGGNARHVFEL